MSAASRRSPAAGPRQAGCYLRICPTDPQAHWLRPLCGYAVDKEVCIIVQGPIKTSFLQKIEGSNLIAEGSVPERAGLLAGAETAVLDEPTAQINGERQEN